jgi:hypothetical protein
MAKLYKVRKKCMICGGVFYPKYAGSLYCEVCKNKKKDSKKPAKIAVVKKKPVDKKPVVKKSVTKKPVAKGVMAKKPIVKKPVKKKVAKKTTKKISK